VTGPAAAATPVTGPAPASPVTGPAPASPLVAPVTLVPEDLAGIDRGLADIDTQLTGAGKDAATPEGDLG
jgi:hypothetical protein